MTKDDEAFRIEAFRHANANPEFIAAECAELIRYLIRAVAAEDSSSALSGAANMMFSVIDLLGRCQEPLSWYRLFRDASDEIKSRVPADPDEFLYISAAERGMKYIVESSATDGFASARASKAFDQFRQAIKWSEDARRSRRGTL